MLSSLSLFSLSLSLSLHYYYIIIIKQQDNVRTNTVSVQCRDFFARAYLTPNHTKVTTNTSLTSSVMWPFDSPYAISYRCSTVTESVSLAVFEIIGPNILGHDLDLTRSRDDPSGDRFAIGYFLLVVHCNQSLFLSIFEIFDPKTRCAHRHTPQMILYSVPCNVLHWTDNKCLGWHNVIRDC